MVSYGPDIQNQNFTHMWSFVDYRSSVEPQLCVNSGSIYDYINRHPEMKKFKIVIDRAMMSGQLNDEQANFTILIPLDGFLKHIPDEYFQTMDNGLARQILNASTMNRRIEGDLLVSSPVAYYYTRNPAMRLYVTNINRKTRVNNCSNVVQFDIKCTNGLIHIVDNIIAPNQDTFMN